MTTESFPIKHLTLLEGNPRKITSEQMKKLCKSIEQDPQFLWNRPVLVNKTCIWPALIPGSNEVLKRIDTYTVYAGNQRVRAAKN